jgi:hypothetical protein
MKKTYAGSCHCHAVRFEADIDLAAGTSKCNCAICAKSRMWKAIVPSSDFRLLQGAADLADYTFGRAAIHHRFCRHCGVKLFGTGDFAPIGAFHAVNVASLDISDAELAAAPVRYEDGRHDNWGAAPAISLP